MMGDKTRGLYGKFHVERTDGQGGPGKKHNGCDYFVPDLTHDQHALPAIRSYAESCRPDYPLLASDLDAILARPAAHSNADRCPECGAYERTDKVIEEVDIGVGNLQRICHSSWHNEKPDAR